MSIPKKEEGPRDFGRFLTLIADGAASSELSTELQRITGLIREEAEARQESVTGKIQLTVSIAVDPSGHADVTYDIVVKEPKKKRPDTLFFVTAGDNLSDSMTKQAKLPIREAPKPRDADADDSEQQEIREV